MGYKVPDSVTKGDFEFFKKSLNDLKKGVISKDDFKGIRVPFGVYEQRERETYMVRVKTYAGEIAPSQLATLADYADKYANNQLHITTRGGIQLHYTKLDDLCEILENLHKIGLTSRGGGGATVRNINADILSNIAADCVFDVIPYANALTTKMLALNDSFYLPKKFKFAFSASSADRAMATITDVGFIAKIKDGKKGFEVYLAGGMGAKPRLGFKFSDFLPEGEVFILAQAAKQVYDRLGDRKVKARARFRFVAEKLGEAELARIVENEMQLVREKFDCSLDLEDSPKLPILGESSLPNLTKEQEIWWKRFVIPQKQEGYFCAKVPLKLGDLSAHHARELAQTIAPFDNHSIYFAPNQNLYLRNLSAKNLLLLYDLIRAISSQSQKPTIIGDMVACTGAATCQLGIARPRGAIEAIEDFLADKNLNLDALQGFRIQLSGCPNSCANHFSANLGFFGKAKKFNGHSYPAYNVVLGGIVSADSKNPSRFARKVAEIPAFHLPKFVALVLELYIAKKPKYPRFEDFVDSEGEGEIVAIAEGLQEIPDFSESTAPYYDFHSDKLFEETYKERGIGEEHFKEVKQN